MEKINIIREISCLVIFNEEGKILMQDREGISKLGELWAFFGGGRDAGESIEEGLIREIKEELDIDLKFGEADFLLTFYIRRQGDPDKILKFNYLGYLTSKKEEDFRVLEGAGCKYMTQEECFKYQLYGRESQKDLMTEIHDKINNFYKTNYKK